MTDITINTGISARPESRGGGYAWDTSAINAARQFFDASVRLGADLPP